MKVAFVCSGRADNLKYLKNNRTLVESTLRNCGWEVVSTSLSDMGDFNKHLQEYKKNTIDEFIFYYTGHGDVSNQQQVLKLQLDNSKVMINDILDSIFEFINPKKQAIILDACYSGTLILKRNRIVLVLKTFLFIFIILSILFKIKYSTDFNEVFDNLLIISFFLTCIYLIIIHYIRKF